MITDVRQISRDRCVGLDRAHRGADYAALAWGMVAECGMCAAKAAVKAKQTAVSAGDAQMALALDEVLGAAHGQPPRRRREERADHDGLEFLRVGKGPGDRVAGLRRRHCT